MTEHQADMLAKALCDGARYWCHPSELAVIMFRNFGMIDKSSAEQLNKRLKNYPFGQNLCSTR